jgi:hypothetical protein
MLVGDHVPASNTWMSSSSLICSFLNLSKPTGHQELAAIIEKESRKGIPVAQPLVPALHHRPS